MPTGHDEAAAPGAHASPVAPTTGSTRGQRRLDRRSGFRRAVGLTLLGTLVPGAGLTQTRSRALGWALLGVVLSLAAVVAYAVLSMGPTRAALGLVARPELLLALVVVVAVLGAAWCASIVLTAVRARPASLDRGRTRLLAALATVLVLAVAGGSFTTAAYALITRDTVTDVFAAPVTRPPGSGVVLDDGEDPWATQKRVNLLLLGSDAASDRQGTRTDSMIVASIDTASGRTTLVSMPRNLLRAPLATDSPLRARYPSGHFGQPESACAQNGPGERGQCMLTNLYMEATSWAAGHPGAYPAGEEPGRLELRGAVEQVVGLDIDQVVVIDLRGFKQLIDAMGGVVVNVKNAATGDPLPIGGKVVAGRIVAVKDHFEPGRQRLDGYHALWYARSRAADSDTYRQARQRCVVKAIVEQVDPSNMLAQYPQLARIAKDNIYTDIAAQDLPAFVDLVGRIQGATITSVTLNSADGVHPGDPDYDHIRELVREGIAPPRQSAPTPAPTSTDASTPSPTGTPTSSPSRTPSPTTTPYSQC